jgi:hypothetical protein
MNAERVKETKRKFENLAIRAEKTGIICLKEAMRRGCFAVAQTLPDKEGDCVD